MTEALNAAEDLATLWDTQYKRFEASRQTIELCGKWARNEIKPHIPAGWDAPESFKVMLPHAVTLPQDVASFVSRKHPATKRKPLGSGTRANRVASRVEAWSSEALLNAIKIDGSTLWDTLCAFSASDGEFAVIVQPAASYYRGMLQMRDENGEILANWRRNKDGDDEESFREKKPKAEYKVHEGKSSSAFDDYVRDFKARRFPFVVRVLAASEYLPMGRDPRTGRLDTLLIRSERTVASLEADGFRWFLDQDATTADSSQATYTLYEFWTKGRVAYQIYGLGNRKFRTSMVADGELGQAVIDLKERYGLSEVPAGCFYGWSRKNEKDPNKKGIPLLFPFIGLIAAANQSLTSKNAHLYNTGFGGWGMKMDPALISVWQEMGSPATFEIKPMTNHLLMGEPRSLVHQGSGTEAIEMIQMLIGLVDRFSNQDSLKGEPSNSAIGQMVGAAGVDTILSMIEAGASDALKFIGECLLEQCAAISDETGDAVPIYVTTSKDGEEKTHIELSKADLDGDFTLSITFPQKKGSDLAKAQAGVAWVEAGRISEREWREDFYGDEQPEQAMDEIAVDQWLKSEAVMGQVMELVTLIRGQRQEKQKAELIQTGELSPGGTPTALLPPRPGEGQASPGGAGNVNPAASALGGQMSGAMQTGPQAAIVRATGQGAETAMP